MVSWRRSLEARSSLGPALRPVVCFQRFDPESSPDGAASKGGNALFSDSGSGESFEREAVFPVDGRASAWTSSVRPLSLSSDGPWLVCDTPPRNHVIAPRIAATTRAAMTLEMIGCLCHGLERAESAAARAETNEASVSFSSSVFSPSSWQIRRSCSG